MSESSDEDIAEKKSKWQLCGIELGNLRLEFLCGLTVALALVPEAVAFALAAGLPPDVGLNSAWIISVVTAIFGGRPAMICGATGSLAVLVPETVQQEHGKVHLFYAVILMGFIEIILGLLNVGTLVKLIPVPVMIGFCNGLALVIGLAQLSNFKDPTYAHTAATSARRLDAFHAFKDEVPFIHGEEALMAGIITVISFVVSLYLPKLSTRVPSALVAILVGTAFEWAIVRAALHSSTPIVGDIASKSEYPSLFWFNDIYQDAPPLSGELLLKVLPLSVTMAAVGLLESLMTLNLIDEITKTKGNPTRECLGQGLANVICGAFGGMGGCAMIGQSMINIGSGARTRLSSFIAGFFLLIIVLVAYPGIKQIPVSALVGVMFNVCYHTFEWSSLKLMALAACPLRLRKRFLSTKTSTQQIRRMDALVILIVTLVTLFTDLATAVAVGMVFSLFTFALETSDAIQVMAREPSEGVQIYDVHGTLFFGSTSHFLELFPETVVQKDPADVRLVFETGHVADFSAVQALNKLGERYGAYGKRVTLQELMPKTHRVLSRAQGLLVEEITLSLDEQMELPNLEVSALPSHLHIERVPSVNFSYVERLRSHSRDDSDSA
eukprot:symbB.v1.2.012907.t1/scaffold856.1/size157613/5